jgi:protein-L-isoaspartate(D-aspartate) O-methyltransferase
VPVHNFSIARRRMIEEQLIGRGIKDPRVIEAIGKVPRHLFVPEALAAQAYSDFPLPIGDRQTISQPYMVALMSEALLLKGGEKVLEIGTGSGYQAAVLALLARQVFSLERISSLARQARKTLDSCGFGRVNVRVTDGTFGWEEEAPFDAIMVTAGAPAVPKPYLQQLVAGGRLIIPVGDRTSQILIRVTRLTEQNFREERLLGCRFVPLVGDHGWNDEGI